MAQLGSALDWGSRGRWFESSRPDQKFAGQAPSAWPFFIRNQQGNQKRINGCFLANKDMPIYLRFCRIMILMDPPSTAIPHFVNLLIPHTQTSSSVWSTYAKESCLCLSISSTCAIDTLPKRPKNCGSRRSGAPSFFTNAYVVLARAR